MPLNIVYLDDEVDLLEIFVDNFASKDRDIKTFSDPKKALDYIHAHPPDVVFLDYRLPNTNGDEVAQNIKFNVHKILITGDIETNTVAHFYKKFPKPFSYDEIEKLLNDLITEKIKNI